MAVNMGQTIGSVIMEVGKELRAATAAHGPLHSAHEGYGVLAEEVAELLDAIRSNDRAAIRAEAVQVAAMGARIVLDCGS